MAAAVSARQGSTALVRQALKRMPLPPLLVVRRAGSV
jgi:hypothetical protein